jgi:hypothetical protein
MALSAVVAGKTQLQCAKESMDGVEKVLAL